MAKPTVGLLYGVGAYLSWGLLPLFWRQLSEVPAWQLVFHRIVWASLMLVVAVFGLGQLRQLGAAFRDRAVRRSLLQAAAFVGINWFCFVYGVETERVLQVSLGYFINPLLSVLLGTVVLGERLRRLQWVAVGLSAAGVGLMTWRLVALPWLSLVLAVTFALYGLVRKTAKVEALVGNCAEALLLAPVAAAMVVFGEVYGDAPLTSGGATTTVLLLCTGLATAGPLLLFTSAARRLPLSTVGFLQYLAPSLHLLVAVFVFGEAFTATHGMTFGAIWLGLSLFILDGVRASRGASWRPGPQDRGEHPRPLSS